MKTGHGRCLRVLLHEADGDHIVIKALGHKLHR